MNKEDLKAIRALPGNDACFDCGVNDAQWASLSFGTVMCIDCSGIHRSLGVHVSFVRSLTLDTWSAEQVAIMKAGGNQKCARAFRSGKVPMAVTEGGGRNSIENNRHDFLKRYHHVAAKDYKQQLLQNVANSTSSSNTANGGGRPKLDESVALTPSQKEELYELARLDPELPWHAPIPSVVTKLFLLALRIVFGFPGLPIIIAFLVARYVLYPDNAMVQGLGYMMVFFPLIGGGLFGRKLCKDFVSGRIPPFKSAQNLLAQKMEDGRAIRTEGYDVFLPPPSKDSEAKPPGLIFYPGWLINHTAYAPIASKLSDAGILVVVVSMEPFRASTRSTELEKVRFLRIMYEMLAEVVPDIPVQDWAVGGHDLGAALAMKIARATRPGTSKLVLWGCGSRPIEHRSARLDDSKSLEVLVLNGSEDKSINGLTFKEHTDFRSMMPQSTIYKTIPGGNHNGFGHYEKPKNRKRDGDRTITLDRQQEIAVEETALFLKGKLPPTPKTQSAAATLPKPTSSKKNE